MSKRVYSQEQIELQGWEKPITIHPLTIKNIRIFYQMLDEASKDKSAQVIETLLKLTAHCMATFEPELSDPAVLEEHLDEPTMDRILMIAANFGYNPSDQNLVQAIKEAGTTD